MTNGRLERPVVWLLAGTAALLGVQGLLEALTVFSSVEELGQFGGERRDLAIQAVERHRLELENAGRLVDLNPRVLAVAIFAERLFCYAPLAEPVVDWFAGNSVGWTQVTTYSVKGAFRALYHPTRFDRYLYDLQAPELVDRWRRYFTGYAEYNLAQLKWALLGDAQFNADAAALVLKQKLLHYRRMPGGLDAASRPDLAATLYHNPFPRRVRGLPDQNGLAAQALFDRAEFFSGR